MLNNRDIDKLRRILNMERVRTALLEYFIRKGYGKRLDGRVNPLHLQDLTEEIEALATKIDIEPHALEINPMTSSGSLGWNMFVLGNQRIYLGETLHTNLNQLASQIIEGKITSNELVTTRNETTPRRIISFITRVLDSCDSGFVDFNVSQLTTEPRWRNTSNLLSGLSGYSHNSSISAGLP